MEISEIECCCANCEYQIRDEKRKYLTCSFDANHDNTPVKNCLRSPDEDISQDEFIYIDKVSYKKKYPEYHYRHFFPKEKFLMDREFFNEEDFEI